MICSNCKKENKDGVKFCAFCGNRMQEEIPFVIPEEPVLPQNKICPACSKENDGKMNFCIACGTKLSGEAPVNVAAPVSEEPQQVWEEEIPAVAEEPMVDITKTEAPEEEPMDGVNRCTACLKDNLPGARFCLYCGNALSTVPQTPQGYHVQSETPKKKKKSGKVVLVILIILLVLGLIAGGLYYAYEYFDLFSFGGEDDKDDNKNATEVTTVAGDPAAPFASEIIETLPTETKADNSTESLLGESGRLSGEEIKTLDSLITEKMQKSSLEICMIVAKSLYSTDTRAKDFIKENGDKSICFVVETENKNVSVEIGEKAKKQLNEKTTEIIVNRANELLLEGKCFDACKELLTMIYNDEATAVYEMVEGASQVVYVTKDQSTTTGKLAVVDWTSGAEVVFTIDKVYLGQDGITTAPSESKCATPQGTFALGFAFSDDTLSTELDTVKIKENMVWVDDSSSKYYNTLQYSTISGKDWSSAEDTYNIFKGGYNNACILIEHNGDGKTAGVSGKGSCIYIAGKEKDLNVSYGDVNVSAAQMTTLLSLLKEDCNPHIVIR